MPSNPCCANIDTCMTDPYDYKKHLVNVDVFTIILGMLLLL